MCLPKLRPQAGARFAVTIAGLFPLGSKRGPRAFVGLQGLLAVAVIPEIRVRNLKSEMKRNEYKRNEHSRHPPSSTKKKKKKEKPTSFEWPERFSLPSTAPSPQTWPASTGN
jgi:hypothetical protein